MFYNHVRAVSSHKVVIALTAELFNERRLFSLERTRKRRCSACAIDESVSISISPEAASTSSTSCSGISCSPCQLGDTQAAHEPLLRNVDCHETSRH